jgi:hypothetical protein
MSDFYISVKIGDGFIFFSQLRIKANIFYELLTLFVNMLYTALKKYLISVK